VQSTLLSLMFRTRLW